MSYWNGQSSADSLSIRGPRQSRCPIARHHTIKDIEENNWSHGTNVRCRAARHRTVAVLLGQKLLLQQYVMVHKTFARQCSPLIQFPENITYWDEGMKTLHAI